MVKKRIIKLSIVLISIILTIFLTAVTLYIFTNIIVHIHYSDYDRVLEEYDNEHEIIYIDGKKYNYNEELSRVGHFIDYNRMSVVGYSIPKFLEWDPCASYEYRISELLGDKLIVRRVWVWIFGGANYGRTFFINESTPASDIIINFYGVGMRYEQNIPPVGTIAVNYAISLQDLFQDKVTSTKTSFIGNLYGLVGDDIYIDISLVRDYDDNFYVKYDGTTFKLPMVFSQYLATIFV